MKSKSTYPTLKAWRDAQGWNQTVAAKYLGITLSYYNRLEHQQLYAGKKLAKAISDRIGVPFEEVLGV